MYIFATAQLDMCFSSLIVISFRNRSRFSPPIHVSPACMKQTDRAAEWLSAHLPLQLHWSLEYCAPARHSSAAVMQSSAAPGPDGMLSPSQVHPSERAYMAGSGPASGVEKHLDKRLLPRPLLLLSPSLVRTPFKTLAPRALRLASAGVGGRVPAARFT